MTPKERRRTGSTDLAAGEHRLIAVRQGFLEEEGLRKTGEDKPGGCEGGIRPEKGRTSQTLN